MKSWKVLMISIVVFLSGTFFTHAASVTEQCRIACEQDYTKISQARVNECIANNCASDDAAVTKYIESTGRKVTGTTTTGTGSSASCVSGCMANGRTSTQCQALCANQQAANPTTTATNPITTTPGTTTATSGAATCGANMTSVAGVCFPTSSSTGLSDATVSKIIGNILSWLLAIFTTITFIAFIISGLQYLTAAGNEDQIRTAKRNAQWSLVGVLVGLSGYVIIKAVSTALSGSGLF